jgi:hypothetical protein
MLALIVTLFVVPSGLHVWMLGATFKMKDALLEVKGNKLILLVAQMQISDPLYARVGIPKMLLHSGDHVIG